MRCALLYLLIGVGVACAVCRSGGLQADEPESIQSLRTEKLKAAKDWWESAQANLGDEVDFAKLFPPARAVKDAQLELATNKRERIKALTEYRDRIQRTFNQIDTLAKVNARGGETDKLAEARFLLLKAKIALKEEEAKPSDANSQSR